jgi:DNA mismatch repair protein MutL
MEEARIRVLPPETAKRIAAGEVIDRPAAALRELLDNAIDSGARSITAELEGGGVELVRVRDDGSGMGRADLELCALPHATSKIADADDLLRLSTLGFRGEALASMAAVGELIITSATSDDAAWRLRCGPGKLPAVEPWRGSRGTTVELRALFEGFPARKQFLKRASAEAAACRQVFVEKAMAFPDLSFRLSSGERALLALPAAGRIERCMAAAGTEFPKEFFRELIASGQGYSARIVAGSADCHRSDKKHLQIYVNGRRVQEYGLAQALEYAYREALPGGAYPYAYAFIQVDPALADFNIHPAKREVRLRNIDDIRRGLIDATRGMLSSGARAASAGLALGRGAAAPRTQASFGFERTPFREERSLKKRSLRERSSWEAIAGLAREVRERGEGDSQAYHGEDVRGYGGAGAGPGRAEEAAEAVDGFQASGFRFRYLGQALGVFLVAEMEGELLLLDQHAAHERMLYDELMAGRAVSQELLVPLVYEPESDAEDEYLATVASSLEALGFKLKREGSSWLLEAAPAFLPSSKTGAVFELLRAKPEPGAVVKEAAARAACRAAVMDGDALDDAAARGLIARALALPDPHCPHGRPIWVRMSKAELYKAVRRTV